MKNIFLYTSLFILWSVAYASPIGCELSLLEPVCGIDLSENERTANCNIHFCPVSYKTYDNDCSAHLQGGYPLYTGICTTIIDSFGCTTSSGHVRSQSQQKCVQDYSDYRGNYTDIEGNYDLFYRNGITTMQSIEDFRPNDFITRQEATKIILLSMRLLDHLAYTGETNECITYKDESLFDNTLAPYIYDLCKFNMMKGSQGYFMPHNKITGAETLAITMRLVDGRQNETQESHWRIGYAERLYNQIRQNSLNEEIIASLQTPMTRKEFMSFIISIYAHYWSIEKNVLKTNNK